MSAAGIRQGQGESALRCDAEDRAESGFAPLRASKRRRAGPALRKAEGRARGVWLGEVEPALRVSGLVGIGFRGRW